MSTALPPAIAGRAPSATSRRSALRTIVDLNERLSDLVRLPLVRRGLRRCALTDFSTRIVPNLLRPGLRVLDAGGGKWPRISLEQKRLLGLHVTGLDLSAAELAQAPAGTYDERVVGDVATAELAGDYDLIVSQTLLEHVSDVDATIRNLAAALKPGGVMAHVLPNARAPFALINRLLGPTLGRRLLHGLFPASRAIAGFPAYYDRCTPGALRRLCAAAGLVDVQITPYFATDYFRCCAPFYYWETIRQQTLAALGATPLCELFAITARKP